MLQHILIKNLVIMRELALELEPGMTALTGETGAGKSILIDALGLVLGNKTDNSLIRAGADKAEIHAIFDLSYLPAAQQWLQTHELDADNECILRRTLTRQGRTRCFINGNPVPLRRLQELGIQLVEIHGQHEHQKLLKNSAQRTLLDAYAAHDTLLKEVQTLYNRHRQQNQRLDRLRQQADDRLQRMDYLQFQIDELELLALKDDEWAHLEKEQRLLANAEQTGADLATLQELLADGEQAVLTQLNQGLQAVQRLAQLHNNLQPASEMLDNAVIQIEESLLTLNEFSAQLEHDPQRLAKIDQRLGSIHELARKHRVHAEELPKLLLDLRKEIAQLENAEASLAELEQECAALQQQYRKKAAALSHSRKQAASRLSRTVTKTMQTLAMKGGHFSIAIQPSTRQQAAAHGLDQIEFLVSTNPGQEAAPLARVASGGELSRISLAIQVATSNCTNTATLIFDEVDSGIGGAVAETVGELLRKLGAARQILCVTHLPQVAAHAHGQLRVEKHHDGKTTETRITRLDPQQRIHELARMLGGSRISPKILGHAKELLQTIQDDGDTQDHCIHHTE